MVVGVVITCECVLGLMHIVQTPVLTERQLFQDQKQHKVYADLPGACVSHVYPCNSGYITDLCHTLAPSLPPRPLAQEPEAVIGNY